MKKIAIAVAGGSLAALLAYIPFFSTKAATPKRLLLVTTTLGFRHSDVPIYEQLLRQMSKDTGEFTIVSTTDSPDFPAAAYKADVDQRNARIPIAQARPNDLPPVDGNFGGPGATPVQWSALTDMNNSLSPLISASASSTNALNQAVLSDHADAADIKAKVDAESQSLLAVANARLEAFRKMQASPAKLNAEQVQALVQVADRPAGPAFGGGRGGRASGTPLTPSQQAAVNSMNSSIASLSQAMSAARASLTSAPYDPAVTPATLKSKADEFNAAELALASAKAAAFAKIQASSDKLLPDQVQQLAQPASRGAFGGGRGPDVITPAVTKVLQQYLSPDKLKDYDAVVFCGTTGELPIPDKDAFFKWIADGHGFIGLHSATDTLHQTPEYIKMIGGEFAGHGNFHPKADVENMDAKSPINAGWGKSVAINEEFYLFKNYDPTQVHLLLATTVQPYTKQAGIYPVSWIKMYGKGRVYYTDLGHRDDVLLPDGTIGDQEYKVRFNQAPVASAVQKQMLNGVRWALGLIDADATPQH